MAHGLVMPRLVISSYRGTAIDRPNRRAFCCRTIV